MDLDVREASLAETGGEVRPAQPGTEPLVGAVERLPAGQRFTDEGSLGRPLLDRSVEELGEVR